MISDGTLPADEPGCASGTPELGSYSSKEVDECAQLCLDHGSCHYFQHHESKYCGLFEICSLTRDASTFGSRAKVYSDTCPPPPLPPLVPPPSPPPSLPASSVCGKEVELNLDAACQSITQNNLGGQGPDAGVEELRLSNVGTYAGRPFDLIIEATTPYVRGVNPGGDTSGCIPGGHPFGSIHLRRSQEASFIMSFRDSATGSSVTLPAFQLSFCDLDGGGSGSVWQEQIRVRGFTSYVTEPGTYVDITTNAADDIWVSSSGRNPQADSEADNPTDPTALTDHQKKLSVSFDFLSTSQFSFSLRSGVVGGSYVNTHQGKFFFTGATNLVASCPPAPPALPSPPSPPPLPPTVPLGCGYTTTIDVESACTASASSSNPARPSVVPYFNNFDGQGPYTSDLHEIRYRKVGLFDDRSFDLVLTKKMGSMYRAGVSSANGCINTFARFNSWVNSETTIVLELRDTVTNVLVTPDSFKLTLMDLDGRSGSHMQETIILPSSAYESYELEPGSSVHVSISGGFTTFTGTINEVENPYNPADLTTEQRQASVKLLFVQTSTIQLTVRNGDPLWSQTINDNRNLFFAGESNVGARCPPLPPAVPPLPSPPPPPPYPVWGLPFDVCGSVQGSLEETYPFTTRAEANTACLNAGCSGLADPSMVQFDHFRWQYLPGIVPNPDHGVASRCKATWWNYDFGGVVNRPGWYMDTSTLPPNGCGANGWNEW